MFLFPIIVLIEYLLPTVSASHPVELLSKCDLPEGSQYVVVIDAGSTASRVLSWLFVETTEKIGLEIKQDLFKETSPGLSSFANDPTAGAQTISELVKEAKRFVPESLWSSTPMVLRATAGLRMIPDEQADALLREVKQVFSDSPFHTTENSVDILSGSDEGLFAWINVNFLSGKFPGEQNKMLAALDMGGGSTQVMFPLIEESQRSKFPTDDIRKVNILGQTVYVYTHSYLGLGLMAARKAILTMDNPEESRNLESECVHPNHKNVDFKAGPVQYIVSGPSNPELMNTEDADGNIIETPVVRVANCAELARRHIVSKDVTKPDGILDFDITAFSFFYDRAVDANLIDLSGGVVTLEDFKQVIKRVCETYDADQAFLCLDVVYITTLLEEGYGFNADTKIEMLKQINGHEVSWSLGAALHVLQNTDL